MAGMVLLPDVMCDAVLWQNMSNALLAYGPLIYGDLSKDNSLEEMAARVLSQTQQRVQRLVLIATSNQQNSPQARAFKVATASSLINSHGHFFGLGQKTIRLSLSEKHANDPNLQSQIHQMSLGMGKDAYCRQLLMARDSDTHLLEPDPPPGAGYCRCGRQGA
ncbi:hypothetical protein LU631_03250 [Erwinia tracheiphila]|uniref:Uncharacterized protein n=1 Tax=Erwinia tracheiphila TaxID=65700 RepID=A0A345CWW3_9GAMM|nr:hypothetical protein [Erwinia tracheiphila]AXF77930.1 hypothetical protein AV903_20970 [Erwinia tracheiphila]UIA83363.1 hypothetical protein LU604_24185 [Erwinia tracheiphila]UIA88451.1 hypothetical protein LU631_03250 [Erwinia tracheiphila]UIA91885.1 hypothetical protein LU632_23200 [Erwinia tracheiphila]UIA96829.1 hypothetical protein LU633_01925 [Erwinia tracheiphila]